MFKLKNKIIGKYTNGNTQVSIYSDGTKIRETQDDDFVSEYPESFDCKITDYCDINCSYCHENSTVNGKHGDILSKKLFHNLNPYTEIAIGGGNPFAHPDLESLLHLLKKQNVIANITINQKHVLRFKNELLKFKNEKLIYGIGVSLTDSKDTDTIDFIKTHLGNNVVFHVINGIFSEEDAKILEGNKILILGYKTFRRGIEYIKKYSASMAPNFEWLDKNILNVISQFKVCSFDNLAIDQLKIKDKIDSKTWEMFYQGDDGSHTMYYDAVTQTAAKSSVVAIDDRIQVTNETLTSLFKTI